MSLRATLYRVVPPAVRSRLADSEALRPFRDAVLRPRGAEALVTGRVTFEGSRFRFTAPPRVLAHAQSGGIEARICRLARYNHRPGSVFIDVGANYGFVSLAMGVGAPDGVRVISVEPDPTILPVLERNLDRALQPEVTTLVDAFAGATHAPAARRVSVDGLVAELDLSRVDFLKIDTDGADLAVLEGAVETLDRFRPIVVVEVSQDAGAIHRLLNDAGYITTDGTGHIITGPPWPENLLAGILPFAFPPPGGVD